MVMIVRVSSRDEDVERCKGTSTSGSSNTVGKDLVTCLFEIGIGEDEAYIACEEVNAMLCNCGNRATHP
jgi:hypothetical protein